MTTLRFVIVEDGVEEELTIDLTKRFMLTEAVALEEDWGLKLSTLEAQLSKGEDGALPDPPLRTVMALCWVAKVRNIVAAQNLSFPIAAKTLPPSRFDFDLTAVRQETATVPENPTPPAPRKAPATRTTRTTSGAKRRKTG